MQSDDANRGSLRVFGWEPEIGDPTIYGWITVAAYAFGALCCWRASRQGRSGDRRFWLLLTVIMVFLCVNKQLDLQSLFTAVARIEARKHGWYAERHEYQAVFIAGLAVASLLVVIGLLVRMRQASGPVRGAVVGLALLLLFIFVRASAMHKMDWLINQRFGGLRANHIMELGGIGIVTLFALAASRNRKKRPRRLVSI